MIKIEVFAGFSIFTIQKYASLKNIFYSIRMYPQFTLSSFLLTEISSVLVKLCLTYVPKTISAPRRSSLFQQPESK